MPATSGASGPTTTRSIPCVRQKSTIAVMIGRVEGDEFGHLGNAGIARRDVKPAESRRLRELPCQRVFAPARSDEQYLHAAIRAPRAATHPALSNRLGECPTAAFPPCAGRLMTVTMTADKHIVADAVRDHWADRIIPPPAAALCPPRPAGPADRLVAADVALLVVVGARHRRRRLALSRTSGISRSS